MSLLRAHAVGAVGANTVSKPTGTMEGDLLYLSVVAETGIPGGSIVMPSGFTAPIDDFVVDGSDAVVGLAQIGFKLAGASEPASYTLGSTVGATGSVICAAYRQIVPGLYTFGGGYELTSTLAARPKHGLVVGMFAHAGGTNPTASLSTGWVEIADVNATSSGAIGHCLAELYAAAAGTITATVAWSSGVDTGDFTSLTGFVAKPRHRGPSRGRFPSAKIRGRFISVED